MRRPSLFLCASALVAVCGGAQAGDRYGAPGDLALAARAPDWNGPLLNWANKADAVNAAAPVTVVKPAEPARPAALSNWATHAPAARINSSSPATPPAQPANQPTSLYDASKPQVVAAAAAKPAPDPYHPVRPTGEVVALSLADLPPAGPSLERQQAAEDDAQVLAAQIARVNAQAAQSRASGKAVPTSTTDLLGGPQ